MKKDDCDHEALYWKMPKGTKVIADSGYVGIEDKIIVYRQEHSAAFKKFMGRAKNRQETLHTRIKPFNPSALAFGMGGGLKVRWPTGGVCDGTV